MNNGIPHNGDILNIYLADLVHTIPGNYVVPLNIAYLAAYSDLAFKGRIKTTLYKDPNALIAAIKEKPPQVLGFSNYIWNHDLNCQIGRYVKDSFPKVVTIMGGPSIRAGASGISGFLSENEFVDFYILFEGEQGYVEFLSEVYDSRSRDDCREAGRPINGCAYLGRNRELIYSAPEAMNDLNKIPSPYLRGYLDTFLSDGLIPMVETNRGCPFRCTFCAWGISAQKKVRKFSLERVYEEFDYIQKASPKSPLWIVADANFGLFERDESIAKKIKKICRRSPSLKRVVFWGAKGRQESNIRIFRHLRNVQDSLTGFQSFDPVVLRYIKRDNIKENSLPKLMKTAGELGVKTSTDLLLGLPGETGASHLETLKKALDFGFDHIDVGNVRLLPGAELETGDCRDKYKIKSKFRLLQGSYGIYEKMKSLETEEVVRSTVDISEKEISYFRLIHWLIWFGWNSGFLLPLLRYLKSRGINPLDFIVKIADSDKRKFPSADALFKRFNKDSQNEWFDSREELRKYYINKSRFVRLMDKGFAKLNYKYTAELLLDSRLFLDFHSFIKDLSYGNFLPVPEDLFRIMRKSVIDPMKFSRASRIPAVTLTVSREVLPFAIPGRFPGKSMRQGSADIVLRKGAKHVKAIRNLYGKFDFNRNKQFATEKILEYFIDAFTYDICTV